MKPVNALKFLLVFIAVSSAVFFAKPVFAEYDDAPAASEEAFSYLHEQIVAHNTSIDMSKYKILLDNTGDTEHAFVVGRLLYDAVVNEYGDTFEASACDVEYVTEGKNTYLTKIKPTYLDGYDMEAYKAARKRALSVIDPSMTDIQKVLVLHDYLISTVEYDSGNFAAKTLPRDDFNAYGVLVNRLAVCNGYSLCMKDLLNELGIENYLVYDLSISHVWNMVIIDGEPYHVEMTGDDPCLDLLGRVWHKSFLITDDEIRADFESKSWTVRDKGIRVDKKATSTRFADAFWKKAECAIQYYDGNLYYSWYNGKPDGARIGYIPAKDESISDAPTILVSKIGDWYDSINDSRQNMAPTLVRIKNGRIFYNTATGFSSCALDGSDIREEYAVKLNEGYNIYGALEYDGKIYYAPEKAYFHDDPEQVLELSEEFRVAPPETEAPTTEAATTEPSTTKAPETTEVPTTQEASTPSETSIAKSEETASLPIGAVIGIAGGCVIVVIAVIVVILSKKKKKIND